MAELPTHNAPFAKKVKEDIPVATPKWKTTSNKLSDTPPSAPDDLAAYKALGYGGVQGVSFGLAPKAVGLFSPEMGTELKEKIEAAQKNYPMSYYPGEALGSLATAKIPGLSALTSSAGPGVKGFLTGAAKSAGVGGLLGIGESNATDATGLAKDAAKGAGIGVGAHALTSAVSPILSAGKDLVKKPLNVLTGTSEDAIAKYMANPQAVENAPSVRDVTENVLSTVGKFKDDVIAGSKASRDILAKEGQRFSGQEIAAQYQSKIDDILARSEGALSQANQSSIKVLENMRDTFAGIDSVSANRLKDELQELGQRTKWEVAPGQFLEIDERFKQDVRAGLDNLLKTSSPAYKEKMVEVSNDTKLLNQINDRFKTGDQTDKLLNRIRLDKAPDARKELQLLDQRFNTSFDSDLQNALAKEAFAKGAGGPGGSRNVNLYGQVGEDIGRKTGIPFAGTMGRVTGAVIDKRGPAIGKGIIDMGLGVKNAYNAIPGSGALTNAAYGVGGIMSQVPYNVPLTDYYLNSPWVGMNKGNQK